MYSFKGPVVERIQYIHTAIVHIVCTGSARIVPYPAAVRTLLAQSVVNDAEFSTNTAKCGTAKCHSTASSSEKINYLQTH